ncbi:MAG TPA: PilZ domain-containing protein [Acidimicrobiia bacterium]|nr:PilZ domain-containing protein [Acidimicrobiia bacterium]
MTQQVVERRAAARTAVEIPVVCQRVHSRGADSAWTGATEDLSGAGMAALLEPADSPAGVGDVIEADLTIDGDRICVRALVVAAEPIGSRVRVRCAFAQTGTEVPRGLISRYCEKLA